MKSGLAAINASQDHLEKPYAYYTKDIGIGLDVCKNTMLRLKNES